MNYKYEYKNPTENGYIKVSKDKYREIIPNYKTRYKYEVYENDKKYLIHEFESLWLVVFNIVMLPVLIVAYSILGIKEIIKEVFADTYRIVFQKKTGSFVSKIIDKKKVK